MTTSLEMTTRDAWHRVAEHILAAAQYAQTGEITLAPAPGGLQTTHGRRLAIRGNDLVVEGHSAPLTTLAAAAEFAGITPGMPASVDPAATPLDLDGPLSVDLGAARVLADWYRLADVALRRFAESAQPVIWPEHFDIGITIDAVNYGASPGDEHFADPYLYVGPHGAVPVDEFWNAPFGAAQTVAQVDTVLGAIAFFAEGRQRLEARS